MKLNWLKGFVCVLAVAVLTAVPAFAQYTPGSVSGTVTDQSGAVIPGATVTLVDNATGATREQETNATGSYRFERVHIGTYTVKVSKTGFRPYEARDVAVATGRAAVVDVIMQPGAITETVTVEATTVPLVQEASPQITGSYDNKTLEATVFQFFGIDAAAFLTPGVLPGIGNINTNAGVGSSGYGAATGTNSSISANGQRARSTNFTIDGQSANDITVTGPGFFIGNFEAIQEYQITTNQFNADQGRNLGATITISTKSGGNDFHGAAYWFFENDKLNARTAFESRFDEPRSPVRYNEGAFTLGGPAIKNKLFFFGGYRNYRNPGSFLDTDDRFSLTNAGVATVRAAVGLGNVPMAVYAVSGPLQKPSGNPTCIPGSTGSVTFAAVPLVQRCQVQRTFPLVDNQEEMISRMDWQGKKNSFTARYLWQNDVQCCTSGDFTDEISGYWVAVPNGGQAFTATHTRQISSRQLNEFRFAYTRLAVIFDGGTTFPIPSNSSNLPRITLPFPYRGFGLATNIPQARRVTDFQFQDNWTLSFGRHNLRAGIDIRRNRTWAPFLPNINGAFGFSDPTGLDYVANTPNSFAFAAGEFVYSPFETDQFYYIQDDLKLRPNLTINLGFRYENNGQPVNGIHEDTLARENDPAQALWLQSLPLASRTFPRIPTDKNNWSPRLGFAYRPRWGKALFGENKTVIRGGFGTAYDVGFYNVLLNTATAAPRVFTFSNTCSPIDLTLCPGIPATATGAGVAAIATIPRNRCDPNGGSSPVTGLATLGCDHDLNALTARILFNQTRVASNFHAPYSESWSLGVQREIGTFSVLEVRYVGTKTVGQFTNLDANPRANLLLLGSGWFNGVLGPLPGGGCASGTIRSINYTAVSNLVTSSATSRCLTIPGMPSLIPAGDTICNNTTASGFQGINCNDMTAGRALDRTNSGKGLYNALQTRYDVRNWRNQLTGGISYTWSRNRDNGSEILGGGNFTNTLTQNPFDTNGLYGLASIDIKHALTVNAIWDTPWMKDQKGPIHRIFGGWELSGTNTFYTGRPWTPVQATIGGVGSRAAGFGGQNPFCSSSPRFDTLCFPYLANDKAPLGSAAIFLFVNGALTLVDFNAWNRCGRAVGCPVVPTTISSVHWIINNAEAVVAGLPPFGTLKHLNSTRGPRISLINIGIFKNNYLGKENRVNIQLRAAMVNAFNHRNFARPDNALTNAGRIFGDPVTPNNPPGRIIRLGARVIF